jgi:hypothetical protein
MTVTALHPQRSPLETIPPPPPTSSIQLSQLETEPPPRPPSVVQVRERKPSVTVRIFSLAALVGCVAAVGFGVRAAYHALSDSFVAPLILSPDNDLVIQSKLNLMRLVAERENLTAKLEEHDATLDAQNAAIERLKSLRSSSEHALDWNLAEATQQRNLEWRNLRMLESKRGLIQDSIDRQSAYVEQLRSGLGSGLVHRADVEREQIALEQLKVAAVVNEQESTAAASRRLMAVAMQDSLLGAAGSGGSGGPLSPEVLTHRDQEVRLELDIMKYEAERRARLAQKKADQAALAHVDELTAQMRGRPLFRAIEGSQNVAFVPYTQMDGVRQGADVYECSVWGVFDCNRVGSVSEVLPGEVATQDPWGSLARGQYAVLELSESSAARAKALRVRSAKAGSLAARVAGK